VIIEGTRRGEETVTSRDEQATEFCGVSWWQDLEAWRILAAETSFFHCYMDSGNGAALPAEEVVARMFWYI